jgi:hypothetical protein
MDRTDPAGSRDTEVAPRPRSRRAVAVVGDGASRGRAGGARRRARGGARRTTVVMGERREIPEDEGRKGWKL